MDDLTNNKVLEASRNNAGRAKQSIQNYIKENNIDTSKWAKDFPKDPSVAPSSESSVAYHYDKHGTEVGAKNLEDYLAKAEAFSKKTDTFGIKSSSVELENGNVGMKYVNNKTKQYIIKDLFGNIISFGSTK